MTPTMIAEPELVRDELVEESRRQNETITALNARVIKVERERDLMGVSLRRANQWLRDRILDVDDLTKINRSLSERAGVEPRKVAFTLDTLEQSRDSLTATGA